LINSTSENLHMLPAVPLVSLWMFNFVAALLLLHLSTKMHRWSVSAD